MQKFSIKNDKLLDEVLNSDPGFELPYNFADQLAVKFERNFAWRQYFREFLIYLAVGLGILAAIVGMLFFLMSEIWDKWIGFFVNNLAGTVGVLIVFTFILFMDKVLLQYFSFKFKHKRT